MAPIRRRRPLKERDDGVPRCGCGAVIAFTAYACRACLTTPPDWQADEREDDDAEDR